MSTLLNKGVSLLSQLYHSMAYSVKKPQMQLEKAMLIISIDVDVGSKDLGMINRGKFDTYVNKSISEYRVGEIEELSFGLFYETFNDCELPATFAIRGQLSEVNNSIIEALLKSPVKHDIGAHGYYHRHFVDLSRDEAEGELNMISAGMKKFGIAPKSFVFPASKLAYLDLLEKYEYKCYRGYGDFTNDSMYIEKTGGLYNIHPSLYLGRNIRFVFLKEILDISIAKKLPFHVWFHLWNYGGTKENIQKAIKNVFVPFFGYASKKEKSGLLSFETMVSAASKVEEQSRALRED